MLSQKNQAADTWTCRYHKIFEPLINTVFSIYQQLRPFSISWSYHRFLTDRKPVVHGRWTKPLRG